MAVRDPCQILERAATEGGTEQTEEQTSARSVVALVTGATGKGGIGYETARQLAKKLTRKGVHIVLAGSKELGEEDLVTFKNESLEPGQSEMSATDTGSESGQGEGSGTEESEPTVESMKLDLSSLASVKEFVKAFKEKYTHLNYLVHCDGVVFVGFEKTVDGFERHFQVLYGDCRGILEVSHLC
jgi:NAD(P)-dependent dehydrogenase (short-subunit alcohol dehydrogenase family)